jgi:hypothetical protein
MSLTINQEKQIRKNRNPEVRLPVPTEEIVTYVALAKKVALYRRAQTLTTAEEKNVRKELLGEIDALLKNCTEYFTPDGGVIMEYELKFANGGVWMETR